MTQTTTRAARAALLVVVALALAGVVPVQAGGGACKDGACEVGSGAFYALQVADSEGEAVDMARFEGRVVLVVNVASECGYTDDGYRAMVALAEKYGPHGLDVVAAPCNQFGGQEPGTDAEVRDTVRDRHDRAGLLTLLAKLDVNGPREHPLYALLKGAEHAGTRPGGDVQWNFERFVVDRDGDVAGRFASDDPWADTERLVRRTLVVNARR